MHTLHKMYSFRMHKWTKSVSFPKPTWVCDFFPSIHSVLRRCFRGVGALHGASDSRFSIDFSSVERNWQIISLRIPWTENASRHSIQYRRIGRVELHSSVFSSFFFCFFLFFFVFYFAEPKKKILHTTNIHIVRTEQIGEASGCFFSRSYFIARMIYYHRENTVFALNLVCNIF